MKKINVVIYIRVSTKKQGDGYSIEYQKQMCELLCKREGYNILAIFIDTSSGKNFDRTGWEKMEQFIKSNKGLVNKVVFLKWDRFARNTSEALNVVKELSKMNISLHCVEQTLDLENPDNLVFLSLYLSMAEVENIKNSMRTTEGMRTASKKGCWMGTIPLGYDRKWLNENGEEVPFKKRKKSKDDARRDDATLKPNSQAPIVIEIYEKYLNGESAESLSKYLKLTHKIHKPKQGVLDILKNVCYIGKVLIKANKKEGVQIVEGLHEPIISEETFQEVQERISGKRRKHIRKDNNEEFPLKEILKCSVCGLSYTASITTKSYNSNTYPYYHCTKTKGHDRYDANTVHNVFGKLLDELKVNEDVQRLYNRVLADTINHYNGGINAKKKEIEAEIQIVQNRILNTEDSISLNSTNNNHLISMLNRYKEDENELINKHANLKAEAQPKNSDIVYLMELFKSLNSIYNESDFSTKKQLVRSIFPNPIYFEKNHFRTEEVSPLVDLMILNSNKLQHLKIETSRLNSGPSISAPLTHQSCSFWGN